MDQRLSGSVKLTTAEQQLFKALQALKHRLDLQASGQWRRYYKEDIFKTLIHNAEQEVERWKQANNPYGRSDPRIPNQSRF